MADQDENLPPQFESVTRFITPKDRIVERGRGCWNCVSFDLDGAATKMAWAADKQAMQAEFFTLAMAQPNHEAFIAQADQWAANPDAIHIDLTDDAAVARAKMILKSIDRMDRSIASAAFRVCMANGGNDRNGKYISARYLCPKWTGRIGSSMATSGHKLDKLPDELREDKK